jgi:homoserine kinase type II
MGEQLVHGDYQETNLFFADGRVSAIIDWDQTHVASRGLEIFRTLDYVFAFALAPCHTFLAAYRAVQPLARAELDCAAAVYGLRQAHNLWIYTAYFLEGNARAGQFITPGGFVPFADRWAALRPGLIS